jgi:hypothetical protein
MQIGMPAERAREVIALQIGLAVLTIDDTTR